MLISLVVVNNELEGTGKEAVMDYSGLAAQIFYHDNCGE
jgi:hypothetical protein